MTRTQRRVWWVLLLAILVTTLLGLPYSAHIVEQGPWARSLGSNAFVIVLSTILVSGPLAALGLVFASRLGLGAPLLEAWIEGREADWKGTLLPPFLWGLLAGGMLLLLIGFLKAPLDRAMPRAIVSPPWWAGALASLGAGISEETLTRLFLLSALAVPLARALPRNAALWIANVTAALVFGALHFGNVSAIGMPLNAVLAAWILVINGGVGLLCGWIFWTRGIEAAMACHVAIDLVLHGLGALFPGAGQA